MKTLAPDHGPPLCARRHVDGDQPVRPGVDGRHDQPVVGEQDGVRRKAGAGLRFPTHLAGGFGEPHERSARAAAFDDEDAFAPTDPAKRLQEISAVRAFVRPQQRADRVAPHELGGRFTDVDVAGLRVE